MLADLLVIQAFPVVFHALKDRKGLYLIDAGFVGGRHALREALVARGWAHLPLRGIIVTHGHLDHILNVVALAHEHGAWVAAPALDAGYYAGQARHAGWSRVTGALETAGRRLLGFQPFVPDRWLRDGDVVDVCDGLKVVALPGHTAGHIGLWHASSRLLFTADLFASFGSLTHLPPRILNDEPALIPGSVRRALALNPEGVLPNHGDTASPEVHLARLKKLAARIDA